MAGRLHAHNTASPSRQAIRDGEKRTYAENRRFADDAAKVINARPDPGYAIRPMTIDDAPFIVDSWASSYAHYARLEGVPSDVYKIEQRARIDRLVRASIVLSLVSKVDNSHVSGWICFQPPVKNPGSPILHYVLIHPSLQVRGLGSQLVSLVDSTKHDKTDPIWATHFTFPMRKIGPKWNLIYNPYLLEVLNG